MTISDTAIRCCAEEPQGVRYVVREYRNEAEGNCGADVRHYLYQVGRVIENIS